MYLVVIHQMLDVLGLALIARLKPLESCAVRVKTRVSQKFGKKSVAFGLFHDLVVQHQMLVEGGAFEALADVEFELPGAAIDGTFIAGSRLIRYCRMKHTL